MSKLQDHQMNLVVNESDNLLYNNYI